MSFQRIIHAETKRQGLTGYRLGKLSGVPIRTVQKYLSGSGDLLGERVAKVAMALGLELRPVSRKGRK